MPRFVSTMIDIPSIDDIAQLYHLEQDIHITDKQYLLALTVFFFPYALFEASPSRELENNYLMIQIN